MIACSSVVYKGLVLSDYKKTLPTLCCCWLLDPHRLQQELITLCPVTKTVSQKEKEKVPLYTFYLTVG